MSTEADQTKEENAIETIKSQLCSVADRPFIKNPLQFFSNTRQMRLLLTVTDNESWKKDIELAEKMFGTILISTDKNADFLVYKDVLKQRLRYPNIKENPELLNLAKIWILPNKVHLVDEPQEVFKSYKNVLDKSETDLGSIEKLSYVKYDLSDGGERMHIYKLLDEGYRPSLLCVKWTKDVDDDYATAYCAGHLCNAGYTLMEVQNGYYLYYYSDDMATYDTASFKEITYGNPVVQNLSDEFNRALKLMVANNNTYVAGSSTSTD